MRHDLVGDAVARRLQQRNDFRPARSVGKAPCTSTTFLTFGGVAYSASAEPEIPVAIAIRTAATTLFSVFMFNAPVLMLICSQQRPVRYLDSA